MALALLPDDARRRARQLAASQSSVVSRRQLYASGVPRWLVRCELRAGRWQRTGRQTVAVHNAALDLDTRRWVAVLEAGPRAALAAATALQAAGVTALTDATIHVIVPKGARKVRLLGVRIHESRRWSAADVVTDGIRRSRPAVAAVHAALWAVTDRQATLFLTLAVQQGGVSPADLADAAAAVRRHARKRLISRVVVDLTDGVRSLGELDVAVALRGRGLPEPDRQAVRRRPGGTVYRDAHFPAYALTLEIDGWQHELPEHRLSDLLRDVATATEGATTVRIPLIAWRLDESAVLDGLEALFVSRGWAREAA